MNEFLARKTRIFKAFFAATRCCILPLFYGQDMQKSPFLMQNTKTAGAKSSRCFDFRFLHRFD